MGKVAELGCLICRRPACVHHIREGQGMSQRARNYLIVPLCPEHHTDGGRGVAVHADRKTFESMYGSELDLLAQTIAEVNR